MRYRRTDKLLSPVVRTAQMQTVVTAHAQSKLPQVKSYAPRRTGNLADSLTIEPDSTVIAGVRRVAANIFADAGNYWPGKWRGYKYAAAPEFGTSGGIMPQDAQHWMRAAGRRINSRRRRRL